MPTIFEPKDLPLTRQDGMGRAVLANAAMLGAGVLQVERITLDGNASTSPFEPAAAERFLYVLRGAGTTNVRDQAFTLEPESVLWIEADDACSLRAGPDGLEVLFRRAPAK